MRLLSLHRFICYPRNGPCLLCHECSCSLWLLIESPILSLSSVAGIGQRTPGRGCLCLPGATAGCVRVCVFCVRISIRFGNAALARYTAPDGQVRVGNGKTWSEWSHTSSPFLFQACHKRVVVSGVWPLATEDFCANVEVPPPIPPTAASLKAQKTVTVEARPRIPGCLSSSISL